MSDCDRQVVVFTDLDGTLLDHDTYSHAAADDLIKELTKHNIPIIPNTSKTYAELLPLRDSLKLDGPFVVENGAAVYIPKYCFDSQPAETVIQGDFWVKEFVEPSKHWKNLISQLASSYAACFQLFSEMSIEDIIAITGLDSDSAMRAAERYYGEPVQWLGSEDDEIAFIKELRALGATVSKGGRFIHVSGRCDKGQALTWLAKFYRSGGKQTTKPLEVIALGDGNNDISMLLAATKAVVIRPPVHSPLDLSQYMEIKSKTTLSYTTKAVGPHGWVEGIQHYLDLSNKQLSNQIIHTKAGYNNG